MENFPRYKLINLIKKYGTELYASKNRCRNFLNDFCGEYQREVFVLSTAVEEKVPHELLRCQQQRQFPVQSLFVQLKERLKSNYAFTEYASLWAVETWALALDIISATGEDKLCLETVSQAVENEELQKSLFFATLIDNAALIDDLVKLGVNLDYTDEKERTALIYAVISGNAKVVEKLLELGVQTKIKDETGYTALQWAVMLGEKEILQSLLTATADLNETNINGNLVLDLAQHYQQPEIYQLLKNFSD